MESIAAEAISPSSMGGPYRRKHGQQVNKENHHHGDAPKPALRRRDWRGLHHSRLFWVGAFLFLAAITVYVLSDDLSWLPRPR